jgi:t-SNARE complex subunit (syntaxin)
MDTLDRVTLIAGEFSDMFSQKITQVTNVISEKISNNKKPIINENIDNIENTKQHNTSQSDLFAKRGDLGNIVNTDTIYDQRMFVTREQHMDDFDLAYLNQCDIEIKNIQKDLIEVNQIFKDINELVYAQSPLIDSIHENITISGNCVDDANKELKKAEEYQKKSNEWMILGLTAGTITTIMTTVLIIVLI